MARILARCPWCSRIFGLTAGGYTHMRSQLAAHMAQCEKRPGGINDDEMRDELDRLMARMRGEDS